MNKEQLKNLIKSRFKTVTRFCLLAGIDRYEMQKLFQREHPDQKQIDRLAKIARSTKIKPVGNDLHPNELKAIREAINAFGGVAAFCASNKRFSVFTMHQIMAGRYRTKSEVVRKLMKALKMK